MSLLTDGWHNSSPLNVAIGGLRQLVNTLLHFPGPERCGAYLEVGPSASHPLRELEIILQAKQLNDPDNRSLGQDGQKYLLRMELKAKGDTEMETRNIKINVGLGRSVTGLKNSLKIQLGITENKFLDMRDSVFCILFSSEISPGPGEVKEILSKSDNEENIVKGSASLRYGVGNSCRNTPTSTNVVFAQSTKFDLGQILTSNYSMTLDLYKSPTLVRSLLDKITTLFKVANLGHDTTKMEVMRTAQLTSEMIVKNNRLADVTIVTDSGASYLEGVNIPSFLSQPAAHGGQNSGNQCTQTRSWVRTVDTLNITSSPSSCWALLSGDCQESPGLSELSKSLNLFA